MILPTDQFQLSFHANVIHAGNKFATSLLFGKSNTHIRRENKFYLKNSSTFSPMSKKFTFEDSANPVHHCWHTRCSLTNLIQILDLVLTIYLLYHRRVSIFFFCLTPSLTRLVVEELIVTVAKRRRRNVWWVDFNWSVKTHLGAEHTNGNLPAGERAGARTGGSAGGRGGGCFHCFNKY